MKRYYRTKDGKIYDTDRYAYAWTTPRFIGLGISVNENILIPKSDLVKEPTDDLQKLCDEFVCIKKDGTKAIHTDDFNSLVYWKTHFKFKDECDFYGSIWVDGNLMKVAQMNEKGGLELL